MREFSFKEESCGKSSTKRKVTEKADAGPDDKEICVEFNMCRRTI